MRKWAAAVVREMFGIPNCRALICLEKESRHPKKGVSFETRYYISSLDTTLVGAVDGKAANRAGGSVEKVREESRMVRDSDCTDCAFAFFCASLRLCG